LAYRRTERVEARLADNRERIVRAARKLIADGGMGAAQVAAVAAAAGVATGTVYRYFPSKADLLVEVIRRVGDREVEVMAAIARGDGSPAERLAAAVRSFARRVVQGRRLAWALIAEPVDPAIDAERLALRERYSALIADIARAGVATGEFPPQDPRVTAACVVGAMIEPLIGPLAPEARAFENGGEALVEGIVAFCLGAVTRAERDAPEREAGHVEPRVAWKT
jgi:AcrR family transcriptional regulator